jgi:uncharacterized protein YegJ (DUF2314 family)
MFCWSKFNSDISKWDVSSVEDAERMFEYSDFNNDISDWKFKSTNKRNGIFHECPIKDEYMPHNKRV